jgi:hypothetical protein
MGRSMLIVNALKLAGKSCVELHNYYINNYHKRSRHNCVVQGSTLSGG